MKLLISRYSFSDKQTIGNGYVLDDSGIIIYEFNTLELPFKDNKNNISCIPIGNYIAKKRYSKKFKTHFHIQDVPNRSLILLHRGNFHTEIRGCVLCGGDLNYIDGDNYIDVANSTKTMKELLKILPKEFELSLAEI